MRLRAAICGRGGCTSSIHHAASGEKPGLSDSRTPTPSFQPAVMLASSPGRRRMPPRDAMIFTVASAISGEPERPLRRWATIRHAAIAQSFAPNRLRRSRRWRVTSTRSTTAWPHAMATSHRFWPARGVQRRACRHNLDPREQLRCVKAERTGGAGRRRYDDRNL